jgi:putative transposase
LASVWGYEMKYGRIIGFLREAEAGLSVKDLCRRHGFSEAGYYLWKDRVDG